MRDLARELVEHVGQELYQRKMLTEDQLTEVFEQGSINGGQAALNKLEEFGFRITSGPEGCVNVEVSAGAALKNLTESNETKCKSIW